MSLKKSYENNCYFLGLYENEEIELVLYKKTEIEEEIIFHKFFKKCEVVLYLDMFELIENEMKADFLNEETIQTIM